MRIVDLLARWARAATTTPPDCLDCRLPLPLYDAARVQALGTLYPGHSNDHILADLVHAALDELELAMPYVHGRTVIAEDDRGAPIYEDLGPTPDFYVRSHEILRQLARARGTPAQSVGRLYRTNRYE